MDSPDDNNIPANRRLPPPAPAPVQRDQHNHIFGRNFMGSIRGLLPGLLAYGNIREADIQFIGAAPAIPMNANPLAGNPPDFNYQANGFGGYGGGRQPTPKPDFEAPPAARAGFTRDTGPDKVTDEEQVFVGGRSAKKVRTKKDREEHHFWAVKACGHVYCKSCYDNRKKHSKGKDSAAAKTGFQFQPSETARSVKIYCAVDDCESEVSPNNAWVGIFM
ncbi:E3 ubiquitin-protein ligase complex slx8-rfp subunit rfp1 [Cytospora mali]|uniref:E3 ubiquitin-protein ligase complex slx8-rfp subunit rfp1 n=1 Tax=Cytospora mali TaxID=578113 RepID=A0A194VNB4_CYTMA|nr:E3 ubiquitin-protein ligase complex slx8-rfp subunit rfp1 [Valsa mali]